MQGFQYRFCGFLIKFWWNFSKYLVDFYLRHSALVRCSDSRLACMLSMARWWFFLNSKEKIKDLSTNFGVV